MRIFKFYIVLFAIILSKGASYSQDTQFSQFFAAPMYLNPALTGGIKDSRITLNQRLQWPRLSAHFNTMAISWDKAFPQIKSGFGVMYLRDIITGPNLKSDEISAFYAYDIPLNTRWHLRCGLQGSYVTKTVDFNALKFGDQFTNDGFTGELSQENFSQVKTRFADISSGFLLVQRRAWVGTSFHHMNKPDQAFGTDDTFKLPIKTSLHGGLVIPLVHYWFGKKDHAFNEDDEEEIHLRPSFNYKQQGKFDQLDLGCYLDFHDAVLGVWYRGIPVKTFREDFKNHQSVNILVGYFYKKMRFGYSYDITTNLLAGSGGAHEFSLSFLYQHPTDENADRPHKRLPVPKM